jgi:hypothetical protein
VSQTTDAVAVGCGLAGELRFGAALLDNAREALKPVFDRLHAPVTPPPSDGGAAMAVCGAVADAVVAPGAQRGSVTAADWSRPPPRRLPGGA